MRAVFKYFYSYAGQCLFGFHSIFLSRTIDNGNYPLHKKIQRIKALHSRFVLLFLLFLLFLLIPVSLSAQSVTQVFPRANSISAPADTVISVRFSTDIDPATIQASTFIVTSTIRSVTDGTYTFNANNRTAIFIPARNFIAGETITVTITKGVKTMGGVPLTSSFSWHFTIMTLVGLVDFKQGATPMAGTTPLDIVAADFDNDGYSDLAVANSASNNVSILRNDGNDAFSPKALVSVGTSPVSLISGDFNSDNYLGIAVCNKNSGSVSILLNDGNASLSNSTMLSTNGKPVSLTAADFDNDGDLDLAVANEDSNKVTIALNNGSGTFTRMNPVLVGNEPAWIVSGDINRDGDMDLVVANKVSNSVSILSNNGAGTFTQSSIVNVGTSPNSITCGDFNADGQLDMAVSNESSNNISILLNMGNSAFSSTSTINVGGSPRSAAAGDMDGDGDLDISVATWGQFSVLLNDGNATFTEKTTTILILSNSLAVNDLDSDGDLDFVVTNQTSGQVSVWKNKNATPDITLLESAYDFREVKIGYSKEYVLQIRNDGVDQPLLITNIVSSDPAFTVSATSGTVAAGDTFSVALTFAPTEGRVYDDSLMISSNDRNTPQVSFSMRGVGHPITAVAPSPNSLTNQKDTDIEVEFSFNVDPTTLTNNSIRIIGSISGLHTMTADYDALTKTGTFQPDSPFTPGEAVHVTLTTGIRNTLNKPMPSAYHWSFMMTANRGSGILSQQALLAVGANPREATIGDWDGDGDLDITVANTGDNTVSIASNTGKGSFTITSTLTVGAMPNAITSGDINSDGDPDLITANYNSNTLSILTNNGAGSFTTASMDVTQQNPHALALCDLDNDGDADLAVLNRGSNNVAVFLNDGVGNFIFSTVTDVGSLPASLGIGDVNNDGDMDVIVVNGGENSVSILLNTGNASLAAQPAIPVGAAPRYVSVSNFDNDDFIDLAVTNSGANTVSILHNIGNAQFSVTATPSVGTTPKAIAAADFDGDGDLDLAVSNEDSDNLSILTNDGNGTFALTSTAKVSDTPTSVVSGDFDNDGDIDLAVTNYSADSLSILKNRVATQDIAVSAPVLNFELTKTNSARDIQFRIRNEGGARSLVVTQIIPSAPFIFSVDPDSGTIPPQDGMDVTVRFAPDDVRQYSDSLSISSNDPDEPIITVQLTGAGAPIVSSYNPAQHSILAPLQPDIAATFNHAMLANTVVDSSFLVYGSFTGYHTGTISYLNGNERAMFSPDCPFQTGEQIQVILTEKITSTTGTVPLLEGASWEFQTAPQLGQAEFMAESAPYTTGANPYALAPADFNHDGFPDVVTANDGENSIGIYFNDQNQAFEPPVTINVGSGPKAVACADINADSFIDIVTANSSSHNVSVVLNSGDGNFAVAVNYTVGLGPASIQAADMNNDGWIDIITVNAVSNTISILLNNSDGSMRAAQHEVVGSSPSGIFPVDIDNDGDMDIVVSNKASNTITALRNDGHSTFKKYTYVTGAGPNCITACDLNGDGAVELITADGNANTLSLLFNNGGGAFSGLTHINTGEQPVTLYCGDLDADGDVDMAVANQTSNDVYVYVNNSSGGLTTSDTISVGAGPHALNGMDISGKVGIIDLLVANASDGTFSVLRNRLPWDLYVNLNLKEPGEQSEDVQLHYSIGDFEQRTVSLTCQYSVDNGQQWQSATMAEDISQITPDNYRGTLTWLSTQDESQRERSAVRFRITPSATEAGRADTTATFILDNYHQQSMQIALVETLPFYKDSVKLTYTIADTSSDTQTLRLYYQTAGQSWQRATITEDTAGYTAANYSGTIHWLSMIDFADVDMARVRLAAYAFDGWQNGTGDTTDVFFVNDTIPKNIPPTIALNKSVETGELSGDITITYQLQDENKHVVSIHPFYSINEGTEWRTATVSGTLALIDSLHYSGSLVWKSATDLPGADLQHVLFKCIPMDEAVGSPDSVMIQLDNNAPPTVYIELLSGKQTGLIEISTHLFDAENDTIALVCQYRESGGTQWIEPSLLSATTDLLPSAKPFSLFWQSGFDLIDFSGDVTFRIQPSDHDAGAADSLTLYIDNINLPVVTYINQPRDEQRGQIPFVFAVDDDDLSEVSLTFNYSSDSLYWKSATVTGNTSGSSLINNYGIVTWRSQQDEPGQDMQQVWFRITPNDGNTGAAFTTHAFHVDNNSVPSISLSALDTLVSGVIQLPSHISDAENDDITVAGSYRVGAGDWQNIHFDPDFTIPVADYNSSIAWNSVRDIGYGEFENVRLRLVPVDNDSGAKVQSNDFSIHNYAGDYTADRQIDYNDLIIFARAWNSSPQDITKEIGPASGAPPLLVPAPDDRLDFEDLMVLVQQWNWFYANDTSATLIMPDTTGSDTTLQKMLVKTGIASRGTDDKRKLAVSQQFIQQYRAAHVRIAQSPTNPWQDMFGDEFTFELDTAIAVMGCQITIQYNPSDIKLKKCTHQLFRHSNGITFEQIDTSSGRHILNAIVLNESEPFDVTGTLAQIAVEYLQEKAVSFTIGWTLHDADGQLISRGQQEMNVIGIPVRPTHVALEQNYPNPFNPVTTIRYQVAATGMVDLSVFNILGQRVRTLVHAQCDPGRSHVVWDGTNQNGSLLSSGIYLCRLKTGNAVQVMKMVLVE